MIAPPRFLAPCAVLFMIPAMPMPGHEASATSPAPSANLDSLPEPERQSLWQAFAEARRMVQPVTEPPSSKPKSEDADFYASNPGQKLVAHFGESGTRLGSSRKESTWSGRMRLAGAGDPVDIRHEGIRLEYEYADGTIEWFKNRAAGIEHGFTIPEAPADHSGTLTLEIALDGLTAAVGEDGLIFRGNDHKELLSYSGLKVWDAEDRILEATMQPSDGGFTFTVDIQDARFPVVIDPLIVSLEAALDPNGLGGSGSADLEFGRSVSLDGDRALIGTLEFGGTGGAYVFVRDGTGTWSMEATLLGSDSAVGDLFGVSVSLDGASALVGANGDEDNGLFSGSAYVFTHDGNGLWTQQDKLVPLDGAFGDSFGRSVGLDGNRALIGADGDNSNSGSAYVFLHDGNGSWSQEDKFTSNDNATDDFFGDSVSLDGDTALVGARGDDDNGGFSGSAYVFTRNGAGDWTQQDKLLPADGAGSDLFGIAVSVDGDTALIGATGDDDNGSGSGSAYVFTRDGTGDWTQQEKLLPTDGADGDRFGRGVSLDADHALVGSADDDSSGSAYLFARDIGNAWSQEHKFLAPSGAGNDLFGWSVSISGQRVLIGAPNADGLDTLGAPVLDEGKAYVFSFIEAIDSDSDGIFDAFETNTGTYVSATNTGTDPNDSDSDDDGLLDGVETNTGTFNDANDTGTDPNVDDTDSDGLLDSVETKTGTYVDTTDTGTDPNVDDTDLDGLLDGVETNTGTFVDSNDTGTDPNVDDTDLDGLLDGVETNTGTYVDANDTGTNPNVADTDLDGLVDGVETNTGTFVDANDTGSDPNTADSDGDGGPDGFEVASGTDPNSNTDPFVTTLTDEDDGNADPANGTGISLREAVKYSAADDTVRFVPALDGGTITLTAEILIDKNLSVDASALTGGITISGDANGSGTANSGDVRIFRIAEGVTASVENLTLTNAWADILSVPNSTGGAAILNEGTLNLVDCRFLNNETRAQFTNLTYFVGGAAVFCDDGSTLDAQGCLFENNRATTVVGNNLPSGGAIFLDDGAMAEFDTCTFRSNSAARGGAIHAENGATPTLSACTLESNNSISDSNSAAGDRGGAIHLLASTLVIEDSSVTTNTSARGGACYANGGSIQATTSLFSGNTFNPAQSSGQGGAFYIEGTCILTLEQSTLSDNQTLSQGGAIYTFSSARLTLNHTTVAGNSVSSGQGGAFWYQSSGRLTVEDSIVAGNTAAAFAEIRKVSSPQVLSLGNNLVGDNSTVTSNFPAGLPNGNGDYVGSSATPLDPLLAPLADNGGPTQTRLPQRLSLALEGAASSTATEDQRGSARPQGKAADIGAVELPDSDSDTILDVFETDTDVFVDARDTGTDPNDPDSDNDTLMDGVETNTGVFVDANNTGTNPNLADSDSDTLSDGVETNTGTFVDANNTGTNPNLADSDSDNLIDGVETNTGTFVDANNTGTNPNLADSDNDTLDDGGETAAGSDPNRDDSAVIDQVRAGLITFGQPLIQRDANGELRLSIGLLGNDNLSDDFNPITLTSPSVITKPDGSIEITLPPNAAPFYFYRFQGSSSDP